MLQLVPASEARPGRRNRLPTKAAKPSSGGFRRQANRTGLAGDCEIRSPLDKIKHVLQMLAAALE